MIVSSFPRLAQVVVLSEGWWRKTIAVSCGAVGALALPPIGAAPAIIVTMVGAVWLLDSTPARSGRSHASLPSALQAAVDGWWLGFGYFLAGLWWLGSAFFVEADQFLWALPLGVLGLPAILAFFTAFGFAVAKSMWSSSPWRIFALAAGVGLSEWLRGLLFSGFPWNSFGMALGANHVLAQIASIIGLYGLTFLAVLIAATPAILGDKRETARRWPIFGAVLVVWLVGFGILRLSFGVVTPVKDVSVRIMQPNIPQAERFGAEAMRSVLDGYMELSSAKTPERPDGMAGVTHLIWPESAFPGVISRDAEALRLLGQFIPANATLVTGAARLEGPAGGRKFYNSIHVIQSGGAILDTYDKVHLVPFGEYLPLGRLLERLRLRQFISVPGGFQFGARNEPLRAPGLGLVLPLICYEAIFPGVVERVGGKERPAVMINVTNDGWFGRTPGPYQHFAQARLRAIEEGLPMIRAANSGVSAVIDPYGRVIASLGLGVAGVVDAALPKAGGPTLFSRAPNAGPFGLLLACVMLALVARRRTA